jgi:hypothetical protein
MDDIDIDIDIDIDKRIQIDQSKTKRFIDLTFNGFSNPFLSIVETRSDTT